MTLTCDLCGRRSSEAETLSWTTSREHDRVQRYCDTCSRTHLRALEGKLDAEFW